MIFFFVLDPLRLGSLDSDLFPLHRALWPILSNQSRSRCSSSIV